MGKPFPQRILRPFGQIQANEVSTALLMFSYSFLAMTTYNIIQPVQRSLFIDKLGATLIPFAQLAAGLLIGVIMTGYTWLMSRLARRWSIPITQGFIAALFLAFWILFRTLPDQKWVAACFYVFGLTLGILLISQFWTLANVVYNPRQAKRLFGFIGGGSSLGGALGALISFWFASRVGTVNLLLISAAFMLASIVVVAIIAKRERVGVEAPLPGEEKKAGVGARRAIELLRDSKHLRLIAIVISFGAIGAAVIDQQLNMATEEFKKLLGKDAMTTLLAQVRLWTSVIGFLAQVAMTSRIHRYLGVGFALMLLPFSLGTSGVIMLLNAALWAPMMARVLDQSLRYTVDKTTREILYMPLSDEIKYEAKPFVDVTIDRFAKGLTAVLLLVLILPSPWGLALGWQKLSFVSITITGIWIVMAVRAKRGYQAAFRQSIQAREIKPAEVRLAVADLSTIETLIQELASPDARRVLYAIDMLESLDKRNLITPLLLYHESPEVRTRALGLLAAALPNEGARWLPAIRRMMADESPEVRAAAVGTLAELSDEGVNELVRPYLRDENPRIAMTAAMVLSGSSQDEDVAAAGRVLQELVSDTRESAAPVRREFAIALRHVAIPRFRRLLIPLLYDPNLDVAEEAMRTVRQLGIADFIFVPTLISLLRNRRLKSSARELLVGYGQPVLNILGHFLRDPDEDIWVRRHIPGAIARIPCQRAMDILIGALDEPDSFLRFKVIEGVGMLHRTDAQLAFDRELIESLVLEEASRHSYYQAFHHRLSRHGELSKDSLLARALTEKITRAEDRIYLYLGLLYPWKDIAAARGAIRRNEARSRSAALEFLDTVLARGIRKQLMPLLEGPAPGVVSSTTAVPSKAGADGLEDIVLHLIQDPDTVLSASAVLFAGQANLSGLQEKLEEVMPTGEAGGWYVFEAASWVGAAFRLQEAGRHALWAEPIPTVEAADRLRRLPLFASLTVQELFRIAGAGSQVRHERGKLLVQEGVVPESLNLLLDGRVACRAATGESREIDAPAALGFQEVLEGRQPREVVRTSTPVVCLALGREECRSLLADDSELVQGLFRMLCHEDESEPARIVFKAGWNESKTLVPGQGLKPIEKAMILKSIPVFSGVSAEEMPGLVAIAEEVNLETGTLLFGESEPPAIYALVSGELSLESPAGGPALAAGPNDVVGVYHTMAGFSPGRSARVMRNGTVLRIGREPLFDLISQRPELLQQLFSVVFRARAARVESA